MLWGFNFRLYNKRESIADRIKIINKRKQNYINTFLVTFSNSDIILFFRKLHRKVYGVNVKISVFRLYYPTRFYLGKSQVTSEPY